MWSASGFYWRLDLQLKESHQMDKINTSIGKKKNRNETKKIPKPKQRNTGRNKEKRRPWSRAFSNANKKNKKKKKKKVKKNDPSAGSEGSVHLRYFDGTMAAILIDLAAFRNRFFIEDDRCERTSILFCWFLRGTCFFCCWIFRSFHRLLTALSKEKIQRISTATCGF